MNPGRDKKFVGMSISLEDDKRYEYGYCEECKKWHFWSEKSGHSYSSHQHGVWSARAFKRALKRVSQTTPELQGCRFILCARHFSRDIEGAVPIRKDKLGYETLQNPG